MKEIGQRARALLRGPPSAGWALAGVAAALTPALLVWGFTVDDALIAVRYASHLAAGMGYRFNAGGPVTDGVTPLPWPLLVAPLARGEPLAVLWRVQVLGLVVWTSSAAVLGYFLGGAQAPRWSKWSALFVLALCVPIAAHAVSGMETALATALATFAACAARRVPAASLLAGLAASLRPELAPWAAALALALTLDRSARFGRVVGATTLALLPFGACAIVRLVVFGRAAPLAVLAKPSDLAHGCSYAVAAGLACLSPILILAPRALWRVPKEARAIAIAGAVHLAAVVAAGGDWMPYARLVVPVAPSLLLAFVHLAAQGRAAAAVRTAIACALGGYLAVRAAPPARHVGPDRERLIESARPWLASARSVAALDVGWPTAATEATIVDLGGLTDPEIAALPGGQTSKRIDGPLLLARNPEVLLLYTKESGGDLARWREVPFPRALEQRLADSDLVASHYEARTFLPLGRNGAGYLVLTRAVDPSSGLR